MNHCVGVLLDLLLSLNKKNLCYKGDRIKYSNVNLITRKQQYVDGDVRAVFWKNKFFEPQKEYRVLITNLNITEPFEVNLGNMDTYTCLMPIEQLFNEKYSLVYRYDNP